MAYEVRVEERTEQPAGVLRAHVPHAGIAAFLGQAFTTTLTALREQGLEPGGPQFACYVPTGDGFDVEAGFPASGPVHDAGEVRGTVLPGGTVAVVLHQGPYDGVAAAYRAVEESLPAHGSTATAPPWEAYLDGPEVPEPRTLVTSRAHRRARPTAGSRRGVDECDRLR